MHTFRPHPAATGGHFKNITCIHLHIQDWKAVVWGLHSLQSQIGESQCYNTTSLRSAPGKVLSFSLPQFPYTQDEDDSTVSLSMVVRITLTHRTQYLSLLLQNLVLLSQRLLWHRHYGETVAPRVGDTCLESQNKGLSVSKFIVRIMKDLRVQKGSCSLGTQIFLFMCPFFFFF